MKLTWMLCGLLLIGCVSLTHSEKTKKTKINAVPLKNTPDDLKDILEEEIEDMRRETTLQENVDRTMADLAREERRMNPRTRGGEDEAMRKMEKHMKSTSSDDNKKKQTSGSKVKKDNSAEIKKKQNEDEEKKKAEEKVEKESQREEMTEETEEKVNQEEQDTRKNPGKPNILILYADDLGYGDVGCFGNTTIRTPGIDRICKSGARLTHHMTADATCTPSRAAFLTGRLPKRLGIASADLFPVFTSMAQKSGLPTNETTFAKVLQNSGYKTGLIGKWHLGLNCETNTDGCHHPNNHGFDYYFGLPLSNFRNLGEDGGDMIWAIQPWLFTRLVSVLVVGVLSVVYLRRYLGKLAYILGLACVAFSLYNYFFLSNLHILNSVLMRQNEVVEQPIRFEHLPQRFVREGEQFLEQRKQDGAPFLLFMSWDQVHTHMHASEKFRGKSAHGGYGDEIEEMDWCTGRMLDKLDELGLTDNTLVYFSSDNGGHHEEFNVVKQQVEGGHNGIFSGGKVMGGQEGGIRVPTAISWPGHIPADVTIDVPTSQMDILPTLLDVLDVASPRDRVLDGKSLLPLLTGRETRSPHAVMFHYCAHWLHAARYMPESGSDVYKLHWYWPDWLPGQDRCEGFACSCQLHHHKLTSPHLYNVVKDPQERHPLDVTDPSNAVIVARIEALRREHEESLEHVPDQFEYWTSVYRPWLQPCCNFPYCHCKDPLDTFS